jgi:hypothetical protein
MLLKSPSTLELLLDELELLLLVVLVLLLTEETLIDLLPIPCGVGPEWGTGHATAKPLSIGSTAGSKNSGDIFLEKNVDLFA